ncbi:hypothetical protein BU23DRAFT_237037 [Bimuria novae-zelandiae CBS 107.79]|uniref:J domain-containing protein n=1 Tax=Bimuria novae-zelandiae CBS 107.79 TaxID=1447943 RepID=A0A6A5UX44_9PLEO|nr:hypothetical protein BU23DRAFT_237037 [Bimuria novae-zelandiae CBS 107.79]
MAKIDVTRNYYADLSIPATASDNDIRKSFRKLALECHPDRHPGQEQQWVSKFQQIQAAHEVLSDPQQRAKYDAERKKFRSMNMPPYHPPNTPRNRPPPPPRNTYTSTPTGGQYYRGPPPPRPQPQSNPQRPAPQHHNTYTNGAGADRFTGSNFRTPPTAKKPEQPFAGRRNDAGAKANVFTAWQKMKQPRAEQPRPNPANPANANNPNGTPFGRSQSTRMPSAGKKGFDPSSTGADEGQARSAYRSNYERPRPSPLDEDMTEDVPFAEANRVRTPYFSTKSGERTSMFGEGVGRSASVRNSPTHRPGSSADPGFYSDSGHRQRASYSGPTKKDPFPKYVSSSDEDEEEVRSTPRKPHVPPPPKDSPRQQSNSGQGIFGTPRQNAQQTNGASPNAFKSKSEESINMKFSPGAWTGKFEGKPDYFAPQKGGPSRGRTSPSRGRPAQRPGTDKQNFSGQSQPPPPPSSFAQSSTQVPGPPPGLPPGHQPYAPPLNTQTTFSSGNNSAPHTAKFDPDAWTGYFKEPSFAYPVTTQTKETSPRRTSAAPKRPNPARKGSVVPESSATKEDQSERKPKYQAFAEDVGGDAMDVDEDSPSLGKSKTAPASASAAAPENAKATGATTAPNGTATAPSPASADKAPAPGLDGLAAELGNVAPFLPATNRGLGLDELKDTLPFKSGASHNHPTKPNTAQKLKNPEVPIAPKVPTKLDPASTNDYFGRMESYARQYRKWNQKMLSLFAAREEELNDLEERFVHQRGETTNKIGFAGYLARIKEDEEVMETWKIGQELHISAMMKCQDVRNKTMKQYLPSG